MRILLHFARAYPRRSFATLACLTLAAAAEGLGLSALLPFLELAAKASGAAHAPEPDNALERGVLGGFAALGLPPTAGVLLATVLGAVLLKGALTLVAKREVGYAVAQVGTDLRLRLVRSLLATRWSYFTSQPVGAFANAFASEAKRSSEAFLSGAAMLSELVALLVYAGVALAASWQLTLLAIPVGLPGLGAFDLLTRVARRAGERQTELLRDASGRLTELFEGVRPLKAMALEERVAPLFERSIDRLNRALRRLVLAREATLSLQDTLMLACVSVGAWAATAWLAIDLSTVFLLALVFIRALTTLNKVQRRQQDLAADESAYWSMLALIERAEAQRETSGRLAPTLREGVELREVAFGYPGRPLFSGLSLALRAGELTAVFGATGSGKTTLADLVAGLVRPDSGAVLVDGVPLEALDLAAWRRGIGYVPQEVFLLNDSVLLNVTLGTPALERADVERALRAAGAWEFVSALPGGIDGPVGERGLQLSGGQRQQLAIARALVRRPWLLILDEATSALDERSEAALWASLARLRGETTLLAISHRPAVLAVADRAWRLEDGRAEELPLRR